MASGAVNYSLRKCHDIKSLHKFKFTKLDEINVDLSRGLCYYDDKLYLPHPNENSISVYTTESKLTHTFKVEGINRPQSLHPISVEHLMVAAGGGLYVIDVKGKGINKILEGDYVDVHSDGEICAAIEHVSPMDKIHIVSTVKPYTDQFQFYLKQPKAVSVHVTNGHVYVTYWETDHVTKYSIQGQRVGQYRWYDGEIPRRKAQYWSRLCMSDDSGWFLVADEGNDRIQAVSLGNKKWREVFGTKVRDPHDALVIGNKFFVLSAGAPIYSIIMYEISS